MKKYKVGDVRTVDELNSLGGYGFIEFITDASLVCRQQVYELSGSGDIDWSIKSVLSGRSGKVVSAFGVIVNSDSDDKLYNLVCHFNGADVMCNKEVLGLILSTVGIFKHSSRMADIGETKQAKLSYQAYLKLKDFCCHYLKENDLDAYLRAID